MDYQHDPLPQGQFIRLLHVDIDSNTKHPTVNFQTIPLNADIPKYTAISYAWEDSSPFQRVLCKDGRQIWLSKTLSSLFASLAKRQSHFVLWIDALCINQDDVEERGHQVNLMAQVYSLAEKVVIWLGEGCDETNEAFELVGSRADCQTWPNHETAMLMEVFKRSWFGRLWVVQEATVGKDVWMMCGDRRIRFEAFESVVWSLWNSTNAMRFLHAQNASYLGLRCATRILALRRTFWTEGSITLEPLLEAVFPYSASDSRDFIFGIRGLVDRPSLLPVADYTTTVEEVFTKATAGILSEIESLDLLALCGIGPRTLGSQLLNLLGERAVVIPDQLPSWVLDPRLNCYDEPLSDRKLGNWNAGGPSTGTTKVNGNKELHVFGRILGKVSTTGPTISTWSLPALKLCLNRATKMADRETVWRALIMDLDMDEGPASEELRSEFDELLTLLNHNTTLTEIEGNEYFRILRRRCCSWRIFTTSAGYFGSSWPTIKEGDAVCMLQGCKFPLILRPTHSRPFDSSAPVRGTLIGWCYVHGMMYGEVLHKDSHARPILIV